MEIKLVIQRDGENNQAHQFSSYNELYQFADKRRDKEPTAVVEEAPKEEESVLEEASEESSDEAK